MSSDKQIQKALSEMSRAQSDYFNKYGEHDKILQRRIDALMDRAGKPVKKKTKKVAARKPTKKKKKMTIA